LGTLSRVEGKAVSVHTMQLHSIFSRWRWSTSCAGPVTPWERTLVPTE